MTTTNMPIRRWIVAHIPKSWRDWLEAEVNKPELPRCPYNPDLRNYPPLYGQCRLNVGHRGMCWTNHPYRRDGQYWYGINYKPRLPA